MIDPFEVKRRSKRDPRRVSYVVYSRLQEALSRLAFDRCALPLTTAPLPAAHASGETAVTAEQRSALLDAIHATEPLGDTCIVEVGAYRGATTRFLAENTSRQIVAVDPFIGYGGNEDDLSAFKANTRALANVVHLRATSGRAAHEWRLGPVSLIFVDAVHDYVNTSFDAAAWTCWLVKGGLIAFHDTDNPLFAGTRRAVFELSKRMSLFSHVEGLTILQAP